MIEFKLITQKEELAQHQTAILDLFRSSFNKELNDDLWQWNYLRNPFGNPVVSLAFANEKLIGHYAVIPFGLEKNQLLNSFLSMTTMVDPDFRGQGLFVKQAQLVYDHLEKIAADLVFGFPNQNSAHGFKKHLGWLLPESDYIAELTLKELKLSNDLERYLKHDFFSYPLENNAFRTWRLSKPLMSYADNGNTIWKAFGTQSDLIYFNELEDLKPKNEKVQVLLDSSVNDLKQFKLSDYQFGFRLFNTTISEFNIKKDMILSDIF